MENVVSEFSKISNTLRQQRIDTVTKELIRANKIAPSAARKMAEIIVNLELSDAVHSPRTHDSPATLDFGSLDPKDLTPREKAQYKKQQNSGPRTGKQFDRKGRRKY